jgi:RNA polymerase sigma factor (sigma-70 family)
MSDDRALVQRAIKGDGAAFDEIVQRYQDGLFRHLLRLTRRREDAEDLCQESFIAFYRALRRFDPARPVAPFLFTIATNAWRTRLRTPTPQEQSLDEQDAASDVSIAEQATKRVEHEQVLAAVARLGPEQQEAISLYYDQGLSYREIARITRVSVGTVSTRLHRALDNLRQALLPTSAGLVVAASGADPLSLHLISALQGEASAPASLGPAIAQGIVHTASTGAGFLSATSLWKEGLLMAKVKAVHVVIGLAVVGGATFGTVKLINRGSVARLEGPGRITAAPSSAASLQPVPDSYWYESDRRFHPRPDTERILPRLKDGSEKARVLYATLSDEQRATLLRTGTYSLQGATATTKQAQAAQAWLDSKEFEGSTVIGAPPGASNHTFIFARNNDKGVDYLCLGWRNSIGQSYGGHPVAIWPGK